MAKRKERIDGQAAAVKVMAAATQSIQPPSNVPLWDIIHKHGFNAAMVIMAVGLGVFLPTSIVIALQRFSGRTGTAASLQGFVQMTGGALGALVVGLVQPALPVLAPPLVMLGAIVCACLVFAVTPQTKVVQQA